MKKYLYILMSAMLMAMSVGCSSDSDDEVIADLEDTDVNVLLIRSDNGKVSKGTMYGSNELYNPPHGYLNTEIRYNGGNPLTFYHMGFGANIKGSDVFCMLGISFESDKPMSFSNLKPGDSFDSSQFHAAAAYASIGTDKFLREATALSGKVTVIGTKKAGDKTYMVLRLINLQFDAIDHSCVYTVNGTVEYEIWNLQYE